MVKSLIEKNLELSKKIEVCPSSPNHFEGFTSSQYAVGQILTARIHDSQIEPHKVGTISTPVFKDSSKVVKSLKQVKNFFDASSIEFPEKSTFEANVEIILRWLATKKLIFGKIGEELYVYVAKTGAFQHLHTGTNGFPEFLLNILPKSLELKALDKRVTMAVRQYLVSANGKAKVLSPNSAINYVNFKNGVLDLKTGSLLPKSPTYGFLLELHANWVPNTTMASNTKTFLKRLANTEFDYVALLQIAGYALSNYRSLQLSPYIVGPPNNGKSTFVKIIEGLLPSEAVVSFALNDFSDKFAMACLNGKHVSTCADIKIEKMTKHEEAVFKKVVAGDSISARKIYADYCRFENRCLLIFASNGNPKNVDPKDGVARRIWLVKTNVTVPKDEVDRNLLQKLLEDRDAFATAAIQEFSKIFNNQTFPNTNEFGPESFEFSNSIALLSTWIAENLVEIPNAYIRNSELFAEFCKYVKSIGKNPPTQELFYKRLHRELPHATFIKKNNANTLNHYCLRSLNADSIEKNSVSSIEDDESTANWFD